MEKNGLARALKAVSQKPVCRFSLSLSDIYRTTFKKKLSQFKWCRMLFEIFSLFVKNEIGQHYLFF